MMLSKNLSYILRRTERLGSYLADPGVAAPLRF